jgi:DNA-binding response OmpR family regulator
LFDEVTVNAQLEAPKKSNGLIKSPIHDVEEKKGDSLYCPTEVNILVIDDDTSICQLIQGALNNPSYKIETVSAASQIEMKLQQKPYQLIILDYVVPGVDSNAVFEWVKRDQADASVVVITGFPSLDSVVSCLRARTYDYLTKPFDVAQLENVVRRCLESKGLLRLSEEALRETLGTTIRERRKALGFTLAQMAERTSVSLGYLSQIELGKNSASIETLYRICLGLGMKMSELFQTVHS